MGKDNGNDKYPPFKRHYITQSIIDEMKTIDVDGEISYKKLQEVSGVDCQKTRGYLTTAMNILCDKDRMVFRSIPNQGYVRLNDEDIAIVVQKERGRKIQTQTKKSKKELLAADYTKLSPTGKNRWNLSSAMFATLSYFLKPSSQKRLEGEVEKQQKALDFDETIGLFKSK